ncbi:bifunctional DedA family/phosphatase PAP2 family protein [Oceanicella sp. SM1341]|uniref:bifunctional DedA family/phosphatase PAP2 family protein n=1 Tax=Oceanicella sp. SM1341 TaxID=1548889 RepID=UPI000E4E65B5|nr:phosphatase PAP2 family protein [Oceanicella sp. SM1341]
MYALASQFLPSLESLGIWSYWIIGLLALLEGWWLTGAVVPGTLAVDAGGLLVRMGHLDFADLCWFVAIGAILGGEVSWQSGRWLAGHIRMPQNRAGRRAEGLLARAGGPALLLGRLLGPVGGLVAFAAALGGMSRRRFVLWNILGGIVCAPVHVGLGYLAGDLLARLAPWLPRLVLPLGLLAALALVTWLVTRQLRQGLPVLLAGLAALRARVADWPPAARLSRRFPRLAGFLARRLDARKGRGLLTTAIIVLALYLGALFIDGALDIALVPDAVALDRRVASLAHAYWTPEWLRAAGWLTQAGYVPVASLVAVGAVLGFLATGRRAAALGLALAGIGNAVSVTLLKLVFGRARPELSYFLETSHSFPSGHAAISVGLYGTLALMLWRERLVGPTTALVAGVGLAAVLGLTRIYLVAHYLSDVLNGWVIGSIWLVIGLGLAEGLRKRDPQPRAGLRRAGLGAMALCLCAALWIALTHTKSPVERPVEAPDRVPPFSDTAAIDALPTAVVALGGEPLAPVTLLVAGPELPGLRDRLVAAGWEVVPQPSLGSVFAAIRADVLDLPPATDSASMLAFHGAAPAALTLRGGPGGGLLRLWPLGVQASGRPVTALALSAAAANGEDAPPAGGSCRALRAGLEGAAPPAEVLALDTGACAR